MAKDGYYQEEEPEERVCIVPGCITILPKSNKKDKCLTHRNTVVKPKINHEQLIIEAVAEVYNIEPDNIKGNVKTKEVIEAKKVAIYLIKERTGWSCEIIRKIFDYSSSITVSRAYNCIKSELANPDKIKNIKMIITKAKDEYRDSLLEPH